MRSIVLPLRSGLLAVVLPLIAVAPCALCAQSRTPLPTTHQSSGEVHRTRLILRDGSYQLVMSYKQVGDIVHYRSAERAGQEEEIPANLIDWDATAKWEQAHSPAIAGQAPRAPVIDPELAKEEAEITARTPEVATNLHLPERESVLALDTFQGTPELVPLTQSDGDLNRQTAHNILKAIVNPVSTSHQVVELKGVRSAIQLHVNDPEIYVRIKDDTDVEAPSNAFTVDTHGTTPVAKQTTGSSQSQYVIVRVDVRRDVRIVSSFSINMLGGNKRQEDVIETESTLLPGGYWMRLKPKQPMDFGEYALMEVLSEKEINLGVWDFGVHPRGPENRDAIKPEERRQPALEKRP